MNQHLRTPIVSLLISIALGLCTATAPTLAAPTAPSKLFIPLLLNSLYPFEILDKSIVKYSPPKSSEELFVFTGALRNNSKRVVFGAQFTANFYKQTQLIHSAILTPIFEAHFPNKINYFRSNISANIASADHIEIALKTYNDISLRSFAAVTIISTSPPPTTPPANGLYNYVWVLHNPNPYPLVDVIAVADSNSGYVSAAIGDMTANETLTRTFTINLRPYSALAAQGSTLTVR